MKWLLLPLAVFGLGAAVAQTQPAAQPSASGALARSMNDAFADVYEKVAPTVVIIEVTREVGEDSLNLPAGLNFFFQTPDNRPSQPTVDQGSGFLISADGYIVTNHHVVDGALEGGIKVTLKDGRHFDAQLIGLDKKSDIAVIKVDATGLPFAQMGDSDSIRVGQFAFAIGAPFDLPYTFTVGVISAKGRNELLPVPDYQDYIQTDASINPGNSGGPLCDIDGKVVGVNTLISGMNRGLGFAVPSNMVKDSAEQLMATGHVSRPWLGISIVGLQESDQAQQQFPGLQSGVLVNGIGPGTPAYSSDLRAGDVILKVDGVAVSKAHELQKIILSKHIGQQLQLDVFRNGRPMALSVRTGEQPTEMIRASNRMRPPGQAPSINRRVPSSSDDLPQNHVPGLSITDAKVDNGVIGALVTSINDEAAAAGLMPGDIITEAGGKPVRNAADLEAILAQADLSRGVMMMVDRRGQKTYAILKL